MSVNGNKTELFGILYINRNNRDITNTNYVCHTPTLATAEKTSYDREISKISYKNCQFVTKHVYSDSIRSPGL